MNGKVERSHRTDADEFYGRFSFRSPVVTSAQATSTAVNAPSHFISDGPND